ncbi:ATP-binding protein [Thiohalospira sp.]|uniref:ATP-binding protein n=1 Tax=Thiohalospira sp. TaxID=3080549 RepID=UPI00397FBD53
MRAPARSARGPAPLPLLLATALLLLLLVLASAWLAARGPWLGIAWEPTPGGLQVTDVSEEGPLAGHLAEGEIVAALRAADGTRLPLAGLDPDRDPHNEADYAGYNAYLDRQGRLAEALNSGAHLVTADGRTIPLEPAARWPLSALPPSFWGYHLFGLLAAMMGIGTWVFRRELVPARLLALSGLGFFAATATNSLYLVRELALPRDWFHALAVANHLALALMVGALLALMFRYPRRLLPRGGLPAIAALVIAWQANEVAQWVEWPGHTFYLPLLAFFGLAVVAAVRQWQCSSREPESRAALKWFFLSIFLSMGLALAVYFVPLSLGAPPLLAPVAMIGFAATLYLGLAAGILRYRLFDLERWWFRAWAWFFGGLAVLLADVALAWLFGLAPVEALGLALIAAGWVYFPARQWIWRQVAASTEVRVENHLPDLVAGLFTAPDPETAGRQWRTTLTAIFQPLGIREGEPREEVRLADQGATLIVPDLEGGPALQLLYGQEGRRLFTPRDTERAEALLAVAGRVARVSRASAEAVEAEQRRIARDLHDDVAGHLLALIQGADSEEEAGAARAALQALREAITALDDPTERPLELVVEQLRTDLESRARAAGIPLEWATSAGPGPELPPRTAINLRHILQEAVTNALRHAHPSRISIRVEGDAREIRLEVANDGVPEADHAAGRGHHNMAQRARELNGKLEQGPDGAGLWRVSARLPLADPSPRMGEGHPPM